MTKSIQKVSGLILAGGRGSRIDEKDKGLLYYQGKRLVERQIDWFDGQVDELIISANRNQSCYKSYGLPVINDSISGYAGPLVGVAEGLKACKNEWLFVLPVDMPTMPINTLELLLKNIAIQPSYANAYYLESDQRQHYLSLLIAKSVLHELEKYINNEGKRVRDFLSVVGAKAVNLGFEEAHFKNLNTSIDFTNTKD